MNKLEYNCTKHIVVLGLGNILLKDEGIGVHIVEQLREHNLPGNVELVDGGTAGLDALLIRPDIDTLIVIDAMKAGQKDGTIYKAAIKADQLNKLKEIFPDNRQISLHQMGLIEALNIAEKMDCTPKEIIIIGAEPAKIDCGLELTEQMNVGKIVNTVLKEIENALY